MSAQLVLSGLVERVDASAGELSNLARTLEGRADIHTAVAYSNLWRRIHQAVEAADVAGLSEVTEFVCFNAQRLVEACQESTCESAHIRTLNGALGVLKDFLNAPLDAETLGALITYLQRSDWPISMGEDQAFTVMGRLLEQLQDEEGPEGELGSEPPQPETAGDSSRDDYRLSLPDDAHPQLVDAFFHEVPQLAEEFSQHVQNLLDGTGSMDDLLRAQRMAHTIKGSSNVTGVPATASLMHACEDLLESLYRKRTLPDVALSQIFMETADCLASQLEYLRGEGPEPTQTESLVDALKGWGPAEAGESTAAVSQPEYAVPEPETAQRDETYSVAASTDVATADAVPAEAAPADLAQAIQGQEETARSLPDSMRVSSSLIEDLLRKAGEVSISTVQLQGLNDVLRGRVDALMKQQTLLWERLNAVQELVETRTMSTAKSLAVGHGAPETVFDSLELDEYNELHSAVNFLAESVTDAREYTTQTRDDLNRLGSMLKQQDLLSRELNEAVMGTRMVPFRSITSRLARVVRQTARSTGKSVELHVHGEDVLVDSAVLNRLTDPLMHLLRNAVDHGIEDPGNRVRAGKPETGSVDVRVERYGDSVSLVIRDDGRGLDYDRIRRTGVERGLIQPGSYNVTEPELTRLILVPGFSTRDAATQISGRGIGMDVVNSAVIEQRGTLDVQSEPGRGMSVNIRVPMTLISVHTLLVRNSGVVLGMPSSSVEQLMFSDLGEWKYEADEPFFEFEERRYRVVWLSRLVGIESPVPPLGGSKPRPLLLVQGEREAYAVVLEEVLDNRYLVVKRLGRYVPQLAGIIGGAILADGSIAGVVDIRELLRRSSDGNQRALQDIARTGGVDRGLELPTVLVVDDSVSARRSLSELVSDAGYRSVTAVDGLDALASIDREKPTAVLMDMEMPRMNGLELAAHLRAAPATSEIPLIMITSRSTEKHRRQAEIAGVDRYFTKPYQEDKLIDELRGLIH
jgi:chemosensory pili system protein ChpA (sensor histidine kinase/response regulator)